MKPHALEQKFNFARIAKFTLPTIIMMVFLSMYTIIDGAFVSNYVGENALAGVNIAFPFVGLYMGVAIMFSMGASAIVSRLMGAGDDATARRFLSFIYIVAGCVGVAMGLIGYLAADEILIMLGATEILLPYAKEYLSVLSLFAPMVFFQVMAQAFLVTAGKPILGMSVTMAGGALNILFDYIFIGVLDMGVTGASIATGIGWTVPGVVGVVFLLLNKRGRLHFGVPKFYGKKLLHTCTNGSSELVTNISNSVITFLFNFQMLKYVGEMGVSAITVIQYLEFFFIAVFTGYSQGVMPVIGYKYGANNTDQLKKIIKISLAFVTCAAVIMVALCVFGAGLAADIFLDKGSPTYAMATHGIRIYSISLLFVGFNIFVSSMFTAFGNGAISAALSAIRTLVCLISALLILPLIFEVEGIWMAIPVAEGLSIIATVICFLLYSKRYKYDFWRRIKDAELSS